MCGVSSGWAYYHTDDLHTISGSRTESAWASHVSHSRHARQLGEGHIRKRTTSNQPHRDCMCTLYIILVSCLVHCMASGSSRLAVAVSGCPAHPRWPDSFLQVGYVRGSGTTTLVLHSLYPRAFPEYHYLSVSLSFSAGVMAPAYLYCKEQIESPVWTLHSLWLGRQDATHATGLVCRSLADRGLTRLLAQ